MQKQHAPTKLIALAAVAVALPLMVAGCTKQPDTVDPSTPADATAEAKLEQLKSSGKVPGTFPASPTQLRVEVQGEEFGIHWKGTPMTEGCEPASAQPNAVLSPMLLQDAGIEDVQQCGTLFQASQADGSYIAWNAPK
ncbi:hypothetical protein ACFSWE_09245 [Leucobacter albus]|uniref:Lipoprotein n=1 Tax=Leucobacter albus TaxID=272210 RepID=A0ABW3TQS2_9MICO